MGLGLAVGIPVGIVVIDARRPDLPALLPVLPWLLPGLLLIGGGIAATGWLLLRRRLRVATLAACFGMTAGLLLIGLLAGPALDRYKPSAAIGDTVRALDPGPATATLLYVYGYDEPTLSFYTGLLKSRISNGDEAALRDLAATPGDWLLLVRVETLADRAPETRAAVDALPLLGRWEGFQYNSSDNRLTLELRGPVPIAPSQTRPTEAPK